MRIQHFNSYDALSQASALLVINALQNKPDLLLCATTGNSPTGFYQNLVIEYKANTSLFSQLRIFKLDEWGGMRPEEPASCEYYIRKHILEPLEITEERYLAFDGQAKEPEAECKRVQGLLEENGPLDICILGLGANGHMGLNEPSEQLTPHSHVADLAETTLSHGMVASLEEKPTYGLTIGIEDILAAKHIIMLVVGKNKQEATDRLLSSEITNQFPATHLWKHSNVDCLVLSE